ncbi:MAG: hypothetical protein KatS3mg060_0795 [Dehalococcoidia bacterium]|nr:MAG: hypothetical protein KatS3mg060_0795 [Dehalococcoidia bacterium]
MSAKTPELAALRDSLLAAVETLLACLDGLDGDAVNWRPPAPAANSLSVLASHVVGSVEERVLGTLLDRPIARDRAAEFVARHESAAPILTRWRSVRLQIETTFATLEPHALDRVLVHPHLGPMTGRELILFVTRHAAEHAGQAQLTRDLALAYLGKGRRM